MSEIYDQLPETAVALLYDGQNAPRVTAKGHGKLAEEIFQLAREHGIPLQNDPQLAAILSQIPLGDEIPEASISRLPRLSPLPTWFPIKDHPGSGSRIERYFPLPR